MQVPSNLTQGDQHIARLLLHEDDDMVTICAHTLQSIVYQHPTLRNAAVQGLVALVIKHDPLDVYGLHTLMGQLLGLVDLWNERVIIEKKPNEVMHPSPLLIFEVRPLNESRNFWFVRVSNIGRVGPR